MLFSATFAGHVLGWRDALASAVSLTGVMMVTQLPILPAALGGADQLGGDAAPFSLLGVLSGLGVGVCGGAVNVLMHAPALRAAEPALLTACQMASTTALALPILAGTLWRASPPGGACSSTKSVTGPATTGAASASVATESKRLSWTIVLRRFRPGSLYPPPAGARRATRRGAGSGNGAPR